MGKMIRWTEAEYRLYADALLAMYWNDAVFLGVEHIVGKLDGTKEGLTWKQRRRVRDVVDKYVAENCCVICEALTVADVPAHIETQCCLGHSRQLVESESPDVPSFHTFLDSEP